MGKFLTGRRMSWALVLWSAYVLAWAVITDAGPALFTLWSLTGSIVLGSLWLATQPAFQRGRGLNGLFVRPSRMSSRVLELLRSHQARASRRDAR